MTDATIFPSRWRRHSLRLYGGCCIGANLLLALKGLAMHDPFLQTAGLGTLMAQGLNMTRGEPVKPYTIPTIIAGAGVFMLGGLHAGNLPQICFGSIKALGVSTLFYGKHLAVTMRRMLPGAQTFSLPAIDPRLVGEAFLGVAAFALGVDGYYQLSHGLRGTETATIVEGALTLTAAVGLLAGQRFASLGAAGEPVKFAV